MYQPKTTQEKYKINEVKITINGLQLLICQNDFGLSMASQMKRNISTKSEAELAGKESF